MIGTAIERPDPAFLPGKPGIAPPPRWTIVLAFYNEAGIIVSTLRQLRLQTRAFRLLLVDNGSTDHSAALCHAVLAGREIDYTVIREDRAGQTAAFAKAMALVDTEFVATCDADTYYPTSYLATAEATFDAQGSATVAVSAFFLPPRKGWWRAGLAAARQLAASLVLPRQTHVGAAGQSFRTIALRRAGGYSPTIWPFVLADHEVMHRVMKQGRQSLSAAHWCSPSDRRRIAMRWSLAERLAYHLTPFMLKDRYFGWLGRRLAARGLVAASLRLRG